MELSGRHTTISMMKEHSIDETTIKKIVGHSGAMTLTERVYTHLDILVLIDAINKIVGERENGKEEISEHSPDKNYEDIEIHSVRAGNTPSSHRVVFGCMGEKMEISHDAYDWRCYASGACDAVLFMKGKRAGLYTMEDVIEDNKI